MEGLDVLPVFLQQGDEEVHGQVDVLGELLLRHGNVAHCHVETEHLVETTVRLREMVFMETKTGKIMIAPIRQFRGRFVPSSSGT